MAGGGIPMSNMGFRSVGVGRTHNLGAMGEIPSVSHSSDRASRAGRLLILPLIRWRSKVATAIMRVGKDKGCFLVDAGRDFSRLLVWRVPRYFIRWNMWKGSKSGTRLNEIIKNWVMSASARSRPASQPPTPTSETLPRITRV
jgi:hypothetical protein